MRGSRAHGNVEAMSEEHKQRVEKGNRAPSRVIDPLLGGAVARLCQQLGLRWDARTIRAALGDKIPASSIRVYMCGRRAWPSWIVDVLADRAARETQRTTLEAREGIKRNTARAAKSGEGLARWRAFQHSPDTQKR